MPLPKLPEPEDITERREVERAGTWSDWISLSKGTVDPRKALLGRRLRFRGSPLELRRFMKTFPRRRG